MAMAVGPTLASTSAPALRERLVAGADALRVELGADQVDTLLRYLDLLARWNRVYNLTAVRDPNDMLTLHLLDSLAVLPLVRASGARTIVDVGTGAGLPGIPLAIGLPGTVVDLVDAVAKKVAFLQQAKAELKLTNIHPYHARVEALTLVETPDLIISRAYAELHTMLQSIDRFAARATTVIAMKGVVPRDELDRLPPTWRADDVVELAVPGLGAERCAVVLHRTTGA